MFVPRNLFIATSYFIEEDSISMKILFNILLNMIISKIISKLNYAICATYFNCIYILHNTLKDIFNFAYMNITQMTYYRS